MMASVIICSRKSCRQRIENEAVPIIGSIHAQVHEPTVATDGAAPGPSSGSTHACSANQLAVSRSKTRGTHTTAATPDTTRPTNGGSSYIADAW